MKIFDRFFKRCPVTGKITGIKPLKNTGKVAFFITGILSVIWILIRVIPKPGRAAYPCMKATMPVAASFIAYLLSVTGLSFLFKKLPVIISEKRKYLPLYIFAAMVIFSMVLLFNEHSVSKASSYGAQTIFSDPLGPNNPIGEPKGIFPGRVVWVYNPDATNENCTNADHDHAYFQDANTNQDVVDDMFSKGIKELTGKTTDAEAWDAVFRYFNIRQGKGDTGYVDGETIFLKINAVTAWSGAAPDGEMPARIPVEFDTSPQTILTMLRELVIEAGIPQENIYVGDPMCDIWNHIYTKCHDEFPNVKYCSKRDIPDRFKLTPGSETGITYSDKGSVMDQVTTHKFFTQMTDADYLLNIPTMKGHRWGGVTFFAKNHFGSNTTDGSWQLHKGLMKPDDDPLRDEYHMYRVFVDLMASKYLGGKTLLYFMDALWSTSYEHQKPQKFRTYPFQNDWSSSVLLSLDPVAIESVCLNILQKEFKEEEIIDGWDGTATDRFTFVQNNAVDDYLHQAASSEWWPEGIVYDPDNTGDSIPSLGVHEHWNNDNEMMYSRDLGTGDGIELIKIFPGWYSSKKDFSINENVLRVYPNPVTSASEIGFTLYENARISVNILTQTGQIILNVCQGNLPAGTYRFPVNLSRFNSGVYYAVMNVTQGNTAKNYTVKLIKK